MGAADNGAKGIDATQPVVKKAAYGTLIKGQVLLRQTGSPHLLFYGKELHGKNGQVHTTSVAGGTAGYTPAVQCDKTLRLPVEALAQIQIIFYRIHMSIVPSYRIMRFA
jgi:hypothetical protein